MKFICPICSRTVESLKEGCKECGFEFTLGNVVKVYAKAFRDFIIKWTSLRCPECDQPVPITAKECGNCQQPMTIRNAKLALRKDWIEFLRGVDAEKIRRIQSVYLIFSAFLLWLLLDLVDEYFHKNWINHALLSVVFLAVLAFVSLMVIPKRVFTAIRTRTGWRVRLSLVLNYLSLLVGMQMLISAMWSRSLMLAGFFGVTCLAVWLFRGVLVPTFIDEPQDTTRFDPTAPQGRRGRYD